MNSSQRADLILWTLSLFDYLILLTFLKVWDELDTKEKKKITEERNSNLGIDLYCKHVEIRKNSRM